MHEWDDEVLDFAVPFFDGRLRVTPLPKRLPPSLTADDLYLYSKLKRAGRIGPVLEASSMGPVAAYRSLLQLLQAGLVEVSAPAVPNNLP